MPLFILTGFLGSGKTTLLQRILKEAAQGTGVLINEFGEAGLDHRIVSHVAEISRVVANGCLCCSIRPELTRGLLDLVRRSLAGDIPHFRRLVIETSGLSDPAPIINTIQSDTVLREYFKVAGVLTTVDAVNGLHSLNTHVEVTKQVGVADRIILTKTDLADPAAIKELGERLQIINPVAWIGDARDPGLDTSALLSAADRAAIPRTVLNEQVHHHDVRTFSLIYDDPIDWSAFVTWLSLLLNRHGEKVLRLKGILNVGNGEPPVLIHGVQHIMHAPEHMAAWPDTNRRSELVFIAQSVEPDEIRASLARFLTFVKAPAYRIECAEA
jgi:G3E family GTPase